MNDETKLRQLYEDMYAAMVAKDEAELDRVHDDSFVLVHMTGMNQDTPPEKIGTLTVALCRSPVYRSQVRRPYVCGSVLFPPDMIIIA